MTLAIGDLDLLLSIATRWNWPCLVSQNSLNNCLTLTFQHVNMGFLLIQETALIPSPTLYCCYDSTVFQYTRWEYSVDKYVVFVCYLPLRQVRPHLSRLVKVFPIGSSPHSNKRVFICNRRVQELCECVMYLGLFLILSEIGGVVLCWCLTAFYCYLKCLD